MVGEVDIITRYSITVDADNVDEFVERINQLSTEKIANLGDFVEDMEVREIRYKTIHKEEQ